MGSDAPFTRCSSIGECLPHVYPMLPHVYPMN